MTGLRTRLLGGLPQLRLPWGTMAIGIAISCIFAHEYQRDRAAQAEALAAPSRATTPGEAGKVFAEGRLTTASAGEVTISSEVAGRIVKLHKGEGDVVSEGETLLEVDVSDQLAERAELFSMVREAKIQHDFLEKEHTRTEELGRQGVLAQALIDKSRYEKDAAHAKVESLLSRVRRLNLQIQKGKLVAPIAGKVKERLFEVGEVIGLGASIFVIYDPDRVQVEAEVGEFDIAKIRLGQKAHIRAEGFEKLTLAAVVFEIPDSVTSRRLKPLDPGRPSDTRVLPVKLRLDSAHPLKLGQRVEVELEP